MGGDALQNCTVRRYSPKEYFEITKEVLERLALEFEEIYVPRKLGNKSSYGDLDILYVPKESGPITKERLQKLFPETKEIIIKSPTSHFELREFQIDIHWCSPEEFVVAKYWYEFGDSGMILSMMAHESGFHFGSIGLYVDVVEDEEAKKPQALEKMFLSTVPSKIWEFFGLSLERWEEGFDDEKSCTEYLMSSRFFKPFMFREGKLSGTKKKRRARQRPLMSFLEKTVAERFPNESEDPTVEEALAARKKIKKEALEFFAKKAEYEAFKEDLLKKKATKAPKIDGERLREAVGLKGKSLGEFITAFKSQFSDFEKYLEEKPVETVIEDAKCFYNTVYKKQ